MTRDQPTSELIVFDGNKPFCDVVMKGGITSGVVYPLAVVELAKKYRLQSIGGTSAGALAAAVTAAAEYGRASGGYQRVAQIPREIAGSLLDKFQPDPRLKPLFDMLIATLGEASGFAKAIRVLKAAVFGYPRDVGLGTVLGVTMAIIGSLVASVSWIVLGLVFAVLGVAIMLGWRILNALRKELPAANYGLCSGATLPGNSAPALTEWLADTIDRVAGRQRDGRFERPLTFGDLQETSNSPRRSTGDDDDGSVHAPAIPLAVPG